MRVTDSKWLQITTKTSVNRNILITITTKFLKNEMDSALPVSSLRLLVPPLRLMSAFMWQIAQHQNLKHYGKLEEFVSLVSKLVPEVLTSRQKATLIMGLRAKRILEMCRGNLPANIEAVKSHVQRIQTSHLSKGSDPEVEKLQAKLLAFVLNLLESPSKKEYFFQEVFPLEYGPDFDKALQVLVGHFLSRLEQLLPVPNFKQTSSLLGACHWELIEGSESVCTEESLLPLIQTGICGSLEDNALPMIVEDRIISTLSLLPLSEVVSSCQSNTLLQSSLKHGSSSQRQNADVESEVDDRSEQNEETNSSFNGSPSAERSKGLQLPEASDTGMEEDAQNQDFEREIKEAIKLLVNENEMSSQETKTPGVNSESVSSTEPEKCISASNPQIVEISDKQARLLIPKVELTRVSLPLELFHSATKRDSQKRGTDQSASEQSGDVSSLSSSTKYAREIPLKSSSLFSRTKCLKCGKHFLNRSELLMHQESQCKAAATKCCECGQVFRETKQLALHRQKSCKMRTYKCIKCGAGFKSLSKWYTHQRNHKAFYPYKCPDCGKEFPSLKSLVIHRREHSAYAVNGIYACNQCEKTFGSYRARILHQKTHEAKVKQPTPKEQEPGKCRFCGETFILINDLRAHLKTHPEYRPHQCEQCGKCFVIHSSLLAHLANHTGEKPLLCAQCGKRFFSKVQLKSHMRCHSSERPHMCPYCGKCFSMLGNLTIHVRIHTGEKPYVCGQCGKGFTSAGDLQVHQRSHTGEKPYCCNICDKRFVASSHLREHKRIHTGERPFSCIQCGKSFLRRYDWNKHMLIHTGAKPFPCTVCQKSYTRRTHLNRHMKSHGAGHQPHQSESLA